MVLVAQVLLGCAFFFHGVSGVYRAECTLNGVSAVTTEKIIGTVKFEQTEKSSSVTVKLDLSGFDANDQRSQHGFHIHQTGSTDENCSGAGGHYNGVLAGQSTHGAQANALAARHVGDLGNIVESASGTIVTTITDSIISLEPSSNNYIIGRAVVVHQDQDDLGLGGDAGSTSTGNAGKRIGCCVIEDSGASSLQISLTLMTLLALITMTILH